ncbi:hypothetical protein ACFLIM_49660 [Nonomuraea sp. M3C6]|uniref:Uncharacterized protein n=1 Tax=Nonomuraea marmarensis TaxID=3351344 RepID=A0ABW7AUZ1_9ACTN
MISDVAADAVDGWDPQLVRERRPGAEETAARPTTAWMGNQRFSQKRQLNQSPTPHTARIR